MGHTFAKFMEFLYLVSLILEHRIFAELFDEMIATGEMPGKQEIIAKMRALHVCGEKLVGRRSSFVSTWLKWIFDLTRV